MNIEKSLLDQFEETDDMKDKINIYINAQKSGHGFKTKTRSMAKYILNTIKGTKDINEQIELLILARWIDFGILQNIQNDTKDQILNEFIQKDISSMSDNELWVFSELDSNKFENKAETFIKSDQTYENLKNFIEKIIEYVFSPSMFKSIPKSIATDIICSRKISSENLRKLRQLYDLNKSEYCDLTQDMFNTASVQDKRIIFNYSDDVSCPWTRTGTVKDDMIKLECADIKKRYDQTDTSEKVRLILDKPECNFDRDTICDELNLRIDKEPMNYKYLKKLSCKKTNPISAATDIIYDYVKDYNTENTHQMIYTIYLSIKYKACNTYTIVNGAPSTSYIHWNARTETLYFPKEILSNLDRCFSPFLIVVIIMQGMKYGHANAGVLSLVDRTFERFEPHGQQSPEEFMTTEMDAALVKILTAGGITYINPRDFCPIVGFQLIEEEQAKSLGIKYEGLCQAWSMWYFEARLAQPRNRNLSPTENIKQLVDQEMIKLRNKSGYLAFIEAAANMIRDMIFYRTQAIDEHLELSGSRCTFWEWIPNNYYVIAKAMKLYMKIKQDRDTGKITDADMNIQLFAHNRDYVIKFPPSKTIMFRIDDMPSDVFLGKLFNLIWTYYQNSSFNYESGMFIMAFTSKNNIAKINIALTRCDLNSVKYYSEFLTSLETLIIQNDQAAIQDLDVSITGGLYVPSRHSLVQFKNFIIGRPSIGPSPHRGSLPITS